MNMQHHSQNRGKKESVSKESEKFNTLILETPLKNKKKLHQPSSEDEHGSTASYSETDDTQPLTRNFQLSAKIKAWIKDLLKFLFVDNVVKEDPFDTLLLKAHYVFASKVMFALFVYSTTYFHADGPIICIDKHDGKPPPESVIDYCLSYPYTEDKNKVRHYALHYRWIHISFLALTLIYKLVKLGMKMLEYQGLRKMLEKLRKCNIFEDGFDIAKSYFINSKGRHGGMYTKFLVIHVLSLGINILAFLGLNITLMNRYWDLPKNLAVEREPVSFDDAYSLIFPPFIQCEITEDQHILIITKMTCGCRLTLMEVYEKLFIMLWFFQVFLALWNILFLFVHIPLPCFYAWRVKLLLDGAQSSFDPFFSCAKKYPISELFAFGCVQHLLPGREYIRLIQILDNDEVQDPNETLYYEETDDLKPPPYYINKKSPPLGFENFQPILTATPLPGINQIAENQNRRMSEAFDASFRQSIGFEAPNELSFQSGNSTYYQNSNVYTPIKEHDTFYTPSKETPKKSDAAINIFENTHLEGCKNGGLISYQASEEMEKNRNSTKEVNDLCSFIEGSSKDKDEENWDES